MVFYLVNEPIKCALSVPVGNCDRRAKILTLNSNVLDTVHLANILWFQDLACDWP